MVSISEVEKDSFTAPASLFFAGFDNYRGVNVASGTIISSMESPPLTI